MSVTIFEMVTELNSFIDCSRSFEKAKDSDINSSNNSLFRSLVRDWMDGEYDESPELLVQRIESLLK